jgi:hypothetical protein
MRNALLILTVFAASSCVVVAEKPCMDGVLDGTETDIDCGGSSCGSCGDGLHCAADADCDSLYCAGGVCTPLPSTTGADTYHIDSGGSIYIVPGTQAGYSILANTGASYRIVWSGDATTSSTYREFTGTVWTTGTFTSVTPGGGAGCDCALESGDVVDGPVSVRGGQRIDFDTIATTGLDGFDFVASTEPVFFDLLIDGQRLPQLVFFGSNGATSSAGTMPFGLTTQ